MEKLLVRLGLTAICATALVFVTGCASATTSSSSTSDESSAATPTAITETLDGTSVSGYSLGTSTFSDYVTTVDSVSGIDCDAAESTTSYDASAKVQWTNPLSGADLSNGVTIVCDVYNTSGSIYDALLTFCKAGGTVNSALSIMEAGNWRYNNTGNTALSYFDYENTIDGTTWTKVALVLGTDGTITTYIDGTETTITDTGSAYTWSDMETFLTSTCDEIAVGVGFGYDFWKASWVDTGSYLSGMKIYTTALTSAQVADL